MTPPDLNFAFTIAKISGHPFIVIVDNKGRQAVTKHIKLVVETICMQQEINPVEHNIIYRDTRGVWDGYNFALGTFIELREKTEYSAAIKLLNQ